MSDYVADVADVDPPVPLSPSKTNSRSKLSKLMGTVSKEVGWHGMGRERKYSCPILCSGLGHSSNVVHMAHAFAQVPTPKHYHLLHRLAPSAS
jgi:hypothetical protein